MDGPPAQREQSVATEEKSCLFPIPMPCGCCGPQWAKIQDCTHFMLMLGICTNFAVTVISVYSVVTSISSLEFMPVAMFVLAALYAVPVLLYFFNVISQYDERLQEKQRQARVRKETLLNSYKTLLADMDGLLLKSAESASGLAERSFESKRRDFQRFLDRAKVRYASMTILEYDLVPQFRRFCLNWLTIFKECSIDPWQSKMVMTEEELMQLNSIDEIATTLADKLKSTDVRFITDHRNQDKMLLNNRQKSLKLQLTDGTTLDMDDGKGKKVPKGSSELTWIVFGSVGCSCPKSGNGADGYPRTSNCLCMGLTVLSSPHLSLLLSLLWGIASAVICAVLIAGADPQDSNYVLLGMMISFLTMGLLSLVCILCQFEQIDVVQQLEREVQELTQQNEVVEGQRKNMKEFWGKAQELTDMWLYRTVPRLDLCKELHSQLEDSDEKELVEQITAVNNGLEDIESRLGALDNWRTDGNLDSDTKKGFSKAINNLCTGEDLQTTLVKLNDVVESAEMKAIQY